MSFEDFELIDNEIVDNSIIKRGFLKIYRQQAANLNDSDQSFEIINGESNSYHQVANVCLQYEMKKEKDVAVLGSKVIADGDVIRLVNNAFAFCFKEARLSTTVRSDVELNKYCGQV